MGCLEVYFRTNFLHDDDEPAEPEIDNEVDELMAEINQQLKELASLPKGTQNSKKDEKVSYTASKL